MTYVEELIYDVPSRLPGAAFKYFTISLREPEFQQLKVSGSPSITVIRLNAISWRYIYGDCSRIIKLRRATDQLVPVSGGNDSFTDAV